MNMATWVLSMPAEQIENDSHKNNLVTSLLSQKRNAINYVPQIVAYFNHTIHGLVKYQRLGNRITGSLPSPQVGGITGWGRATSLQQPLLNGQRKEKETYFMSSCHCFLDISTIIKIKQ